MKITPHAATVVSATIVSFVVGVTSGFALSPQYRMTMWENQEMGLGAPDRYVDLRYLNAMAAHHQTAIDLAKQIESKSSRPEIIALAQEIQKNEPTLIQQLKDWEKQWFWMDFPARRTYVQDLGPSDEKVDLRFLNALIAHHQEGIVMTKEIKQKSSRKEILDDADAVQLFLEKTSITLNNWRAQWYQIP